MLAYSSLIYILQGVPKAENSIRMDAGTYRQFHKPLRNSRDAAGITGQSLEDPPCLPTAY